MAKPIPYNPSSLAPEPTSLTKCYTLQPLSSNEAQKGRVPSDASAFWSRRAGKGPIWKHPKGNHSVTQLEVLMASKTFPESTVPELEPQGAAQKVFLKVTTHH